MNNQETFERILESRSHGIETDKALEALPRAKGHKLKCNCTLCKKTRIPPMVRSQYAIRISHSLHEKLRELGTRRVIQILEEATKDG